jgi:hypothetical protein
VNEANIATLPLAGFFFANLLARRNQLLSCLLQRISVQYLDYPPATGFSAARKFVTSKLLRDLNSVVVARRSRHARWL